MLEIPVKGVLKKKLHINNAHICIAKRDEIKATGYLMQLLFKEGYSVVFYGKNRDYYQYMHNVDTQYIDTLSYKKIMEEYGFPIVDDCDDRTRKIVKNLFDEFEYKNKYDYMQRKRAEMRLRNPALFQCFYLVDTSGSLKEKFICEAALVNLIYSALEISGQLHKLAIFIDMPYRPITSAALEVLNTSKTMENIIFIPLYKADYSVIDKNEYCFLEENEKIIIKGSKKSFEVTYG